jgi:hypothetical protein
MLNVTQKSGAPTLAPKSNKVRSGLRWNDRTHETYDETAVMCRISDTSTEALEEEQRMLRAVNDAAWEVIRKIHAAGAPNNPILAQCQVYTVARVAVEAAMAKAAGYENWAAFEEARTARVIGGIA